MSAALTWDTPIAFVGSEIHEATYDWLVAEHGPPPPDPALIAAVRAAVAEALKPSPSPPIASAEYLSPARLAQKLGVDRKTIDRQLAHMTEGEQYIRMGRRVVIKVSAAMAFLSGSGARALNDEQSLLEAFTAKARARR